VRGAVWYRELNQQQEALYDQGMDAYTIRRVIRDRKAEIDTELDAIMIQFWVGESCTHGGRAQNERYCHDQRKVLRQLEDRNAREHQMYKLNNDKDQVMTVCKVALANLAMWTRDHFFPDTYAHATWKHLAPFFDLPGRMTWERATVRVERRPFNDQQLTRELTVLCAQVNTRTPHLPDGRQFVLSVGLPAARHSVLHPRR